MKRREDDGMEVEAVGDVDDIRRALENGHYRNAKASEIEGDIGYLLLELDAAAQTCADSADDAAHDAVIATVARIRDWMALERDTGKDLDGLLDAILKDAGEVRP